MRAATFKLACSIFCVIFLSVITQAQNSLTHNTGTLEVTIIDNGYIGDDGTGTYGGVVFNGNQNAMWSAGHIFGADNGEAFGNLASFSIEDLHNRIPITGFDSNAYFNEITYHTMGPIFNPDSKADVKSLSHTSQDIVFIRREISSNVSDLTDTYTGIFADWDIGNYLLNRGGYDPSRNLFYMYENGGGTDANYYGIVGTNMDTNSIRGTIIGDFPWSRSVAFGHMISTTFDTITTDGDYRMFLSFGPFTVLVGETLTVDFAIVAGSSLADLQSNAEAAILYGVNVPVELTSFKANVNNEGSVVLKWSTATELNNQMFEIERRSEVGQYTTIGFVEGYGTTTEPQEYSYIDNTVETGTYFYRLKQIDFSGQYEYSDEIEVEVNGPLTFALEQNYPNPFNPSTTIKYSVPENSFVKLSVYNLIGEEVNVLVSRQIDAGFYEIEFNGTGLPSGIYFYKLQVENIVETKKMILMK
jgi:hypothetical protein